MSIIRWNDSFYVHVEEIDDQHQTLVAIINRLADSMAQGQAVKNLGKIIQELLDYTVLHFRTEENICRLVNYPEIESHKKEHADFVRKISQFKNDFENERLGITIEMLNFLCDWLRDHIKKNDMKIGKHIDEKGLRYTY